jgi:ligand-binding SRPBCC domain-containing protein
LIDKIKNKYKGEEMPVFEKSVKIDCSLKELFNFHLDTNNLPLISPKDTKVQLLTPNIKIKQGAVLKLKAKKNFLSTTWEVRIQKLVYPTLLVDFALKSPFSYWEHSHIFEECDEGCIMKDVVHYKLPFCFVGALFNSFVKKQLAQMFSFRHKVTKQLLESKKGKV